MLARTRILLCLLAGSNDAAVSAVETRPALSPALACAESSPAYDLHEVRCRLPKDTSSGRFRLQAHFSGGHDDTSARLEAFLDETPLACDEGSKTKLFGEDGRVSLWCDVTVTDRAPADRVFKAMIRWGHAEYVDFAWIAK